MREAHGRLFQYSSTSARSSSTALPRNRIARYIAGHVSPAATCGLPVSSRAFAEVSAVTNPGPRSSRKRTRTVRTFGRPSGSVVATDAASGSKTSGSSRERSTASSTHCRTCAYGVSRSWSSERPSPE